MPDNTGDLLEGAGYFMSILGTLVLGISVGLGLGVYMTKRRFRCGLGIDNRSSASLVNVTDACGDVIGAANGMILAAAAGGVVAFMCGLVVMVYVKQGGGGD